ncbi:disintegrin and metalloproteinase domain-containing protein 9-like [Danio rerio]|uniref:Disintegrin and metalloproteinase domain-containing protein 9-like n=1 Tax=Danio rerio TaxID=7955 RepID=A0AC58GXC6_DANRE
MLRNAVCGKLQCLFNSNNTLLGATVSVQKVEGGTITCINADFNIGPDVPDPAYVKTGTPVKPSEDGYTVVIKGWTWSATILSTPPPAAWTVDTRQDGYMLSCC